MKKIYKFLVCVLCAAPVVGAQDGFYDAYDYNRWSSEISVKAGTVVQESEIVVNNQLHALDAKTGRPTQQGNWILAGSYVGRHDFFLVSLSGSVVQSKSSDGAPYIESSIFQADAALGLMPMWEGFYILAGGRLYSADVHITSPECAEPVEEGGEQWLDPFAGVRMDVQIFDWMGLHLYGDGGGFGVGSELSWNARAALSWQVGGWALHLGYYIENSEYKSDEAAPFDLDVTTRGPVVGLGYNF